MTKVREKAIKLYWKIAKERCPFHEEEMVHSFLEGFIDCAEYLLPLIEKMKCCQNCKKRQDENYCKIEKSDICDLNCWDCGCDKWEIKEK